MNYLIFLMVFLFPALGVRLADVLRRNGQMVLFPALGVRLWHRIVAAVVELLFPALGVFLPTSCWVIYILFFPVYGVILSPLRVVILAINFPRIGVCLRQHLLAKYPETLFPACGGVPRPNCHCHPIQLPFPACGGVPIIRMSPGHYTDSLPRLRGCPRCLFHWVST